MAKQLLGMELTPEQQLGYVFAQFTENDDEEPGRIVRMERALVRIEKAAGAWSWERLFYDVAKQVLVVLSCSAVLAVLALIALGLKVQIAAGSAVGGLR